MTAVTEIRLPQFGMGMQEGTIIAWFKREGDHVAAGEVVAEIEAEKVTEELVATGDGVLQRILVPEGDTAAVNELLAVIVPTTSPRRCRRAGCCRRRAGCRRGRARSCRRHGSRRRPPGSRAYGARGQVRPADHTASTPATGCGSRRRAAVGDGVVRGDGRRLRRTGRLVVVVGRAALRRRRRHRQLRRRPRPPPRRRGHRGRGGQPPEPPGAPPARQVRHRRRRGRGARCARRRRHSCAQSRKRPRRGDPHAHRGAPLGDQGPHRRAQPDPQPARHRPRGVDLDSVVGTGPGARVTEDDVAAAAAGDPSPASPPSLD